MSTIACSRLSVLRTWQRSSACPSERGSLSASAGVWGPGGGRVNGRIRWANVGGRASPPDPRPARRRERRAEMATVDLARQQLLIGGNWTDAGSGGTYERRFPYDSTP